MDYNFKTGDILLFDGNNTKGLMKLFTKLIKKVTKSNIEHISMILKDPDFIQPQLKGYYVWESNFEDSKDPQDGKIKFGVQITPLNEIIDKYRGTNGKIYSRRINCYPHNFSTEKLKEIHEVVYNKTYDCNINDWIDGVYRVDKKPQKTDRFWCSALIGYIYTKCDILTPTTDWSILRPSDFSSKYNDDLSFTTNISLGIETELII